MAEQRYRFGGPIPESVQRMKSRREYRASRLYAGLEKARRESMLRNPPNDWEQVCDPLSGEVVGLQRCATVMHHPIGAREPLVFSSPLASASRSVVPQPCVLPAVADRRR